MTTKSESVRLRFSIPAADAAVLDFFEMQVDHNLSLRLLVRDYIARNGFVDVACRPVVPQPRRGRPPGSTSDELDEDAEHDEIEVGTTDEATDEVEPAEVVEAEDAPDSEPFAPAPAKKKAKATAAAKAPEPEPEAIAAPEAAPDGQFDPNDLFRSKR